MIMGLDMYLERMPRYKSATASDVGAVEDYLGWLAAKERGCEYAQGTFKDWCGREEIPPHEHLAFYSKFYDVKYPHWDTEKKYGHSRIMEQVGYWRKANAIHNWFVKNVQEGVDDCKDYYVSLESLKELLDLCLEVKEKAIIKEGKIQNGYHIGENGEKIYNMIDGRFIENAEEIANILPTTDGFFFGSTDYNEYYMQDIDYTIDLIQGLLKEEEEIKKLGFYSSEFVYSSSW